MVELSSLSELAGTAAAAPQPEAPVHVQKLDKFGRAYATGKRKDAVARVWVKPGSGKITVNNKDFTAYFGRPVLQMIVQQPIYAAARDGQFDVIATVAGGGLSGQAGALRHGLSKALTYYEPGLRGVLKKLGFLTRDPRVVERKKYGRRRPAGASSSPSADRSEATYGMGKGGPSGRPFRLPMSVPLGDVGALPAVEERARGAYLGSGSGRLAPPAPGSLPKRYADRYHPAVRILRQSDLQLPTHSRHPPVLRSRARPSPRSGGPSPGSCRLDAALLLPPRTGGTLSERLLSFIGKQVGRRRRSCCRGENPLRRREGPGRW